MHVMTDNKVTERQGDEAGNGRGHGQHRRRHEEDLVHTAGDEKLFGHEFDAIQRRLKEPEGTVDIGARTPLDTGSAPSFRPD